MGELDYSFNLFLIDYKFGLWKTTASALSMNSDIRWINFTNIISLLLPKWNTNYTANNNSNNEMIKIESPKFLPQCFTFDKLWIKLGVENLVFFWGGKVGRFKKNLHSSFSIPEWSTCYFSLLLWVNYQAEGRWK